MGKLTVVKGKGGLGRPLAGYDHYSGFAGYVASLPSAFPAGGVAKLTSLADAEALGVDDLYSDETKSTYTFASIPVSSAGAVIEIKFSAPEGSVTLCSYIVGTYDTDNTLAKLLASLVKAINLNSYTHGFTATATSTVLTVTSRPGLGIYANSGTPYTYVINGSASGTPTIAIGVSGVASRIAPIHYQVSEFFRRNPLGVLYLGLFTSYAPSTNLKTITDFAEGQVRQIAVFNEQNLFATSQATALQTASDTLETEEKPLSILYSANFVDSSFETANLLPSLTGLDSEKVSVILAQDMGGKGFLLYKASGKSCPSLGACLGDVSASAVNQCIAETGVFNVSDGTECEVLGLANGQLLSAISEAGKATLDLQGYTYLRKYIGQTGSYWNDSRTCTLASSDYAYIENNRTIDKAIRLIRQGIFPYFNARLVVNSDGTLKDTTISTIVSAGEEATESMLTGSIPELSARELTIDPTQDVLSTSQVIISAKLVPTGIAREYVLNIGFVPKL